jgi:hypothetical protein
MSQINGWINVYRGRRGMGWSSNDIYTELVIGDRDRADLIAIGKCNRIACIQISVNYREGEGIDECSEIMETENEVSKVQWENTEIYLGSREETNCEVQGREGYSINYFGV